MMRIDTYLFENGFYSSRTKSAEAVADGFVTVNGKCVKKASTDVSAIDKIEILQQQKFVSLGGYKIEKALDDFDFLVRDLICCDIGASTGGFTDCLLQRGAKMVYAVDVGDTQLDKKLQCDDRVIIKDHLNARELTKESFQPCDLAVCDCSFISLKLIIEPAFNVIKDDGALIALIKPQFECKKSEKSKRGIVLDKKLQLEICVGIYDFAILCGLVPTNFTNAPIKDKKNIEYLMCFKRSGEKMCKDKIKSIIFQ